MAKYEIITPRPGNAPYSLTGSMLVGGPPPIGTYTGNSGGGLCGWWRLNENVSSTGNVTDSSGNGRSGTFDAASARPGYDGTSPGIIQTHSNVFDGVDEEINIGTAATWDALIGASGTAKMSISAWVYKTDDAHNHFLFRFGGGDLEVYTNTANQLIFRRDFIPTAGLWQCLTPISLNVWTHVAITYDSTSAENVPSVFLNGQKQIVAASSTPAGTVKTIDGLPGYIGVGLAPSVLNWEGNLADVGIWNSILTDTDIAAIHAAAVGPNYYTYRNFDLIGYGQRLSPTGSQERLSLQGIDAQADDVYFPSLLPRVRQGAPMSLWRQGEKISDKYFDDTLAMNPNPQDMRSVGDIKVIQRVNFDWEQLNFGQAPTVQQGESYVETARFNPIDYLESSEETMWPVNLFNLGSLLDHEFDGVIEPFDIRSELLGIVRSRFEGHSVRGGLTGGASETYFGSKQIVDTWHDNDTKAPFFLDAPINWETIPIGAYSNITQEPDAPFYDQTAFGITTSPLVMNNPAYVRTAKKSYSVFASSTGEKWAEGPEGRRNLPLAHNILAWWRLNKDYSVSGNATDSSGNGRDGTFDTAANRPGYAASTLPPYVQTHDVVFTGIGDEARIEAGDDWNSLIGGANIFAKPFSIVCRIKSSGMGGDAVPTIMNIGFGDRYLGAESVSNTLKFGVTGAVNAHITVNFAYVTGQWHHIVATFAGASAGGGMVLYIDGISRGTATQPSADGIAAYSWIGGNGSPLVTTRAWNGSIADVSIWNKALTIDEVCALRDASNGVYQLEMQEDPLLAGLRNISEDKNPRNPDVVDPTEKRANHGFYFGQNAGSIVYGDE